MDDERLKVTEVYYPNKIPDRLYTIKANNNDIVKILGDSRSLQEDPILSIAYEDGCFSIIASEKYIDYDETRGRRFYIKERSVARTQLKKTDKGWRFVE